MVPKTQTFHFYVTRSFQILPKRHSKFSRQPEPLECVQRELTQDEVLQLANEVYSFLEECFSCDQMTCQNCDTQFAIWQIYITLSESNVTFDVTLFEIRIRMHHDDVMMS
jgi:hypothetical protein